MKLKCKTCQWSGGVHETIPIKNKNDGDALKCPKCSAILSCRNTIVLSGMAECVYQPMGDFGLEGYQLGLTYKHELMKAHDNKKYFQVYPNPEGAPEYYETCSVKTFEKFFKLVPTVEEPGAIYKSTLSNVDLDKVIMADVEAALAMAEEFLRKKYGEGMELFADSESSVTVTEGSYLSCRQIFKESLEARLRYPRWLMM